MAESAVTRWTMCQLHFLQAPVPTWDHFPAANDVGSLRPFRIHYEIANREN